MLTTRRHFIKKTAIAPLMSASLSQLLTEWIPQDQYDLIVIGAGTAGLACALAAAEAGGKVLILEKSTELGGTLPHSVGQLVVNDVKFLAADKKKLSQAEINQKIVGQSPGGQPELLNISLESSGPTIEWLSSMGVIFENTKTQLSLGYGGIDTEFSVFAKEGGKAIQLALKNALQKFVTTGNITLLTKHQVVELTKRGNKISGVKALSDTGEQSFSGAQVVLCSGGYSANRLLWQQLHGTNIKTLMAGPATATGDAHALAEKIGAKFDTFGEPILQAGAIEVEPKSGKADWNDGWALIADSTTHPLREIYVNSYGVRFMNEAEPNLELRAKLIAKQPESKCWVVFDQKSLYEVNPILFAKWDLNRVYSEANRSRCFFWGNTLEDVAKRANLSPVMLKQTLDDYNLMCADGNDYDYQRKKETLIPINQGPFFALQTHVSSLVSVGGLAVNTKLQVLDAQSKPFSNLYAVGEALGAGQLMGTNFMGGLMLTASLGLGRKLGKMLIKP